MLIFIKPLAHSLKTSGLLCWIVLVAAMLVSTSGSADEGLHSADEDRRIVHQTSVIENAADGSIVESLQNQLPELSHFELIPERRGLPFQVSADGEIRVARSSHLNFEDRRLWILTLKAKARRESDPYMDDFLQSLADASADQDLAAEELRHRDVIVSVRIHVVDQEESPRLVDERIDVSSQVDPGNVAYIRPVEKDQADKLTYSLKCATSDQLRVDPATGVVSIVDPARLDWQRGRQFIEVEVRDQHGNTSSSVIELTMTEPVTSNTESGLIADASDVPHELSTTANNLEEGSSVAQSEIETTRLDGTDTTPTLENSTHQIDADTNEIRNLHHLRAAFSAGANHVADSSDTAPTESVVVTTQESRQSVAEPPAMEPTTLETAPTEPIAIDATPVVINDHDVETIEPPGSTQSLDDAARTINAATSSSIALNTMDAEAAAVDSLKTADEDGNSVHRAIRATADPLPRVTARQNAQQIAIVLLALISIGVVVYVMYRRARNTRLEVMQRATADSATRLDQYLEGFPGAESASESVSAEVQTENRGKMTSISSAAVPYSDPNASFDPESLVEGLNLTDSRAQDVPSDLSFGPAESRTGLIPDSPQTHSAPSDMPTGPQSPLVLLNDEFLIDDILAPVPKSKDDALLATLQAQLSSINSRFEQLNAENHSSDSQSSFTTAEERSSSHEKTSELVGDPILSDDVASVGETADEPYEPAYELQWDAEIQRYVKVEKRAEFESSDDLPVFSDRQSEYSSHDAALSDSLMSTGTAVCVEDDPETTEQDQPTERVLNLRAELADLFNLHTTTTESRLLQSESSTDVADEPDEQNTEGKSPEESHLDSVAKYLSQLLERSRKEDEADIFVERRGATAGKWDGVDRRQTPKPVKSYIESYLEQHGGALREDIDDLAKQASTLSHQSEEAPRVPREHKPVDVNHLRQNMESFRAVAVRSVETAMAAYQVRLAKGRLVGRSMLITGLIVVVGLGVGTNVVRNFHLEPLNWLICAFILLCIAEFFLRVESIRKNRREMRLKILSAQKPSNKKPEESPTSPLAYAEEDAAT